MVGCIWPGKELKVIREFGFSTYDGRNWAPQQNIADIGTSVEPAALVVGLFSDHHT
jgi:hypothetical protein